MMIVQLNPPIELETPKGKGYAWFVIDYGMENDLYWTVAIHDTGEIWTFNNKCVRAVKNITLERYKNGVREPIEIHQDKGEHYRGCL